MISREAYLRQRTRWRQSRTNRDNTWRGLPDGRYAVVFKDKFREGYWKYLIGTGSEDRVFSQKSYPTRKQAQEAAVNAAKAMED